MNPILLINPWIHDFAAHDLWARPLGLLYLAGVVRDCGGEPVLIDCTDRHHPSLPERPFRPKRFSTGKYPSREIPKPDALSFVPRRYKRYGISPEAFRADLDGIGSPEPKLILVGSRMTHWYTGVQETIAIAREWFPRSMIALGGVYPTLYPEHAEQHSGADVIIRGEGENELARLIGEIFDVPGANRQYDLQDLDTLPPPAYDLLSGRDTLPFLSSRGCPRQCSYCASRQIFCGYRRRDPVKAADNLVETVERFGFTDIAFYDDALLANAGEHFLAFSEHVMKILSREASESDGADFETNSEHRVRFHTPNGLDFTGIDERVAARLREMNFRTVRLSLETADPAHLRSVGRNPDLARFEAALSHLEAAGYRCPEIDVYILMGLPGQRRAEVEATIEYVLSLGAIPRLGEFSPLPGTAEWPKVRRVGSPSVDEEPLLANNSVFFRLGHEFTATWVDEMRVKIREWRMAADSE
jgi:hypothetical protein